MESDEFLNLSSEEILYESIMGKSLIVVEGEYDYIYEYISDDIQNNHYEIIPIKELIGKEGNLAVEELMLDIEDFAQAKNIKYIPHILGIIDRDYREYENRLTESHILFILEYYSIESYFVNREILYNSLRFSIRSKRLMNDSFVNLLYNEIKDKLIDELYVKSIQKLEKHLEIDKVIEKFKLDRSIDTLLKVTKGKDLLREFLKQVGDIVCKKKLYKLCRDQKIKSCDKYNDKNHEQFCLYSTQKYDFHQLKKYAFEQKDIQTLTPIKERIKQLK